MADALANEFGVQQSDIWRNRPFKGGYITQTRGGGRAPWIQLEMNRSLYLADPWFDRSQLLVDAGRLDELRSNFVRALRTVGRSMA